MMRKIWASLTTIANVLIAIPGCRAERLGQGSFGSGSALERSPLNVRIAPEDPPLSQGPFNAQKLSEPLMISEP